MSLVAGVDCSTQATKVVVCEAETGAVVREGRVAHPDATEVDPGVWWAAFRDASDGLLADVEAIAVGAQQHGMVLLDDSGKAVRDALLWNDNRSAAAATALVDELGGPRQWADRTGSVPVASFTVSKLRWTAEHEPERAARADSVLLPHDFLTQRLTGGEPTTDRGDASGTGYWSATEGWCRDLITRAFGRELRVPRVARPAEVVGTTGDGILVAAGTGDNPAAGLGLGIRPGDVVVSIGTSGTAFALSEQQTHDPSGYVVGFADATGHFLPLVCTLNAARVLQAAVALVGADLADLDDLALSVSDADIAAEPLVLLPFLDGERTPALPSATGILHGLTRHNATPARMVRAAVDGLLCGLADAVQALERHGVSPERVVLIGGGARSRAVHRLAAGMFGVPVLAAEPAEYVARGAARQAAWASAGTAEPPPWALDGRERQPEEAAVSASARTLEHYRAVLAAADPLLDEIRSPSGNEREGGGTGVTQVTA